MATPPSPSTMTKREAFELLLQRTQRLVAQHERLAVEHESVVQRARASAEQVVRLQGEVDGLRAERNALKAALDASATEQVESHSTYSQPDPTSAALPQEVINEIVQEIDACIALLQR